MKVVILAGGMGTRLAEETDLKPKPLVEIGGKPILWHIMKTYAAHGLCDFVIALGYRGEMIKRFVVEDCTLSGDLVVSARKGLVERSSADLGDCEDWNVELVETGLATNTGGRVRRVGSHVDGTFMLTWGDGLADIDLGDLLAFHRAHGKLATVTVVRPPSRFGHVEMDGNRVVDFVEKPETGSGWINGAYFVLEPEVLDYIDGDETSWEREPLERLTAEGQLMAYRHTGFWQCMDNVREKRQLEELWATGKAPWKVW